MEEALMMEELVEEVLLRLPPSDPVTLLRAAVVCRLWCRIISAPGFRRSFGQRHRTAPMLGFLANIRDYYEDGSSEYAARFVVPATPFRPRRSEHRGYRALDSRHGRVLLATRTGDPYLDVWDPVTDELRELPELPQSDIYTWNAAVVCAAHASACDHLVCRRGHIRVVFLDSDGSKMRVHVYSSEDDVWSAPTYGPPSPVYGIEMVPTALVGGALFFLIDASHSILKFDLATWILSLIPLPQDFVSDFAAFTTMGDDGLGFARVQESRLGVWSMQIDPKGDAFWVQIRSVELLPLLQVNASSIVNDRLAFAHGAGIFFVGTEDSWFSIDLESGQVREEDCGDSWTYGVVPYTSFYTPDFEQYGVVPV